MGAIAQTPPNPAPASGGPQNIFYGAVPPDGNSDPVIVFVHGLKGIAADWWVNAYDGSTNPMYDMAYAAGYRTAFVSLDPNNQRNVTKTWLQNAVTLQQQIVTIANYYGINNSGVTGAGYNTARRRLYIVAHSMGGLSAEAALLNSSLTALEPTVAPLVKSVFTLSTPNIGTPLADWAFGKGAALAILFGLHTPAVQSMEVAVVASFRATADPILMPSGIQFYTFGGNTSKAPNDPVLAATGLILSGLTAGPNDGVVPLSSVPLPDSYAMNLGETNTNHDAMIQGNVSFPMVNPMFQGLERQITGFSRIATGGFGDENNNFPWSMKWFDGKLYVGTGRLVGCVTALASEAAQGVKVYSTTSCPSDPYTLPLAAEIWQYTPATKTWLRVYQSPQNVPITDPTTGNQVMTARDIGYRGMEVFTEADGTKALYVAGVTSGEIYGNISPYTFQTYPPPRILRSTDGITWAPLPQDPGTFLGNVSQNFSGTFGIRSLTSYNGMLFATAGNYVGEGMVIASANPAAGDNAWFQAAPVYSQFPVWDMQVFNNLLYVVGGSSALNDYFVAYTNAQGTPPYTWNYVVNNGANVTPGIGPDAALSTAIFNNELYVGTDGPAPINGTLTGGSELIRIHTDNTWELVIGTPFTSPLGTMSPVTGIGQYFDNEFNRHFWRMAVYPAGRHQGLYLGTYDYGITFCQPSYWQLSNLIAPQYGADLMMTPDGTNWKIVTNTGFGDGQNEGFRTIENTPFGLAVGAARLQGGTQIWLDQSILDFNNDGVIDQNDVSIIQAAVGQPLAPNTPFDLDQDGQITSNDVQLLQSQCTYASCATSPAPLIIAPPAPALTSTNAGSNVGLSWNSVSGAVNYRVYRQTNTPLLQIFPAAGITISLFNIPLHIPQEVLNGTLDKLCPPNHQATAPKPCTYIYLIEAANIPGNQIGFPVSLDYLGLTQSTIFQDTPPSTLQSLYYVRAEDASGNLSEPSNVVGGPTFASSSSSSSSSLTEALKQIWF